MKLRPRYGSDSLVIDIEVREPGPHPVVQQRQRLGNTLRELSPEEWLAPSRCDGWTVQDVVSHLVSASRFWAASIRAGQAGAPTTLLKDFDPVATPASDAERGRKRTPAETLRRFLDSTSEVADAIAALADPDWDSVAEGPLGHVPIRLAADNALWDCWVHERDITVPLGRHAATELDEVLTALRYCVALGPAFAVSLDLGLPEPIEFVVTDYGIRVVVETEGTTTRVHDGNAPAGAASVHLDGVTLLELLSHRDIGVPAPPELLAHNAGLAAAFDQSV